MLSLPAGRERSISRKILLKAIQEESTQCLKRYIPSCIQFIISYLQPALVAQKKDSLNYTVIFSNRRNALILI